MEFKSKINTIEWVDTYSKMVDQTVFPYEYKFVNITTGEDMFDAIRNMIVRGAPAIGIAGAHGVILFAQEGASEITSREEFGNKNSYYEKYKMAKLKEKITKRVEKLDRFVFEKILNGDKEVINKVKAMEKLYGETRKV